MNNPSPSRFCSRVVAGVLCISFPIHVQAALASPAPFTARGSRSAAEAADVSADDSVASVREDRASHFLEFAALAYGAADPDSSGFDFPDDKRKHLARDITVFVIAAAFVGFFIIKVFLEGDTEADSKSGGNGKPAPQ